MDSGNDEPLNIAGEGPQISQDTAAPGDSAPTQNPFVEGANVPAMALPKADFAQPAPLDLNPTRLAAEKFRIEPVKFNALLNNDQSDVLMALGRGFDLKLGSPILITTVRITFSGEASRIDLYFKSPIRARKIEIEGASAGHISDFEINGFATSLSITPKKAWFSAAENPTLRSIEVFGFEPDKFEAIEKTVAEHLFLIAERQNKLDQHDSNLQERERALLVAKEKLAENELKLKEAELAAEKDFQLKKDSVSALKVEIQQISDEKNNLAKEKTDLESEVTGLRSQTGELKLQLDSLESDCSSRKSDLESKNASLLQVSDKLKKLENDLAVTIDLKGYGRKTLFNIGLYALGILILIELGRRLTNYALAESKEVWTAYLLNPSLLDVKVLVGIKLPFILIIGTALTTLYKFALALLRRIIQNDDKRTSLSEISILAGDLTDSALHGTDISDVERNQLKFAAKMWLVRELLSNRMMDKEDTLKDAEEPSPSLIEWVKGLPQFGEKPKK